MHADDSIDLQAPDDLRAGLVKSPPPNPGSSNRQVAGDAVMWSLREPDEFASRRQQYLSQPHPYTDDKSAQRVVAAVTEILATDAHLKLRRNTWNLWRKFLQRNLVQ